MKPRNAVCVALAAVLVSLAVAQEEALSLDELTRLRKAAAHRDRRIIYDNDGNEPVYYLDKADADELLDKRTKGVAGTQVDTIVYCTWSSGFSIFTHNTKIGEIFDCTAEEPGKGPGSGFSKNKTRQFIEQGTDPLEIIVDYCRKNGIEVFWSMRMNDVHDAWGEWYSPYLFPKLKKDHPEWLMGTEEKRPVNGGWSAVDYGQPEIRDLAFRFIEEVCTNYDIDGVQMDFFRHLNYFRAHAEGRDVSQAELDMMTDIIRRIRTMADEVGQKRGKPILLSVRVPDSLEICKAAGFDLEHWMEEDLIDLLVVSGYFRLNPWETSVALGHKYNVPVYPCLSETRLADAEAKKVRASLECYRARAAEAWNAGADGIYMFNFFNPNAPHWKELGSPETLKPLDKVFTTGARGIGNLSFWYEGGEKFVNRSLLSPVHPRNLKPGQTETAELIVGENLSEQEHATVTLRLRIAELADPADVAVTLNGTTLSPASREGLFIEYPVDAALVKQGANNFEFVLRPGHEGGPAVQDLQLWVRHSGAN